LGPKPLGIEPRESPMPPAVRRDLVAGGRNPFDQLRMSFGHPAEHEASCRGMMASEKVEQAVRARFDARRMLIPGGAGNDVVEGADLEMLLHVDREEMSAVRLGNP